MSHEIQLEELRERLRQIDAPVVGTIDTALSGWTPGYIVALRFDSKRLDPLRDDYSVAPGGKHAIIELRP